MPRKRDEHMFSIELKSQKHLRSITVSNANTGNVLVEGFLGKLQDVNFTEGVMLEINGANGNLRMDLTETDLKALLQQVDHQRSSDKKSVSKGGQRR